MEECDANLASSNILFLSWRSSLTYGNLSIYLVCKSMDWFLSDRDLHTTELMMQGLRYEHVSFTLN